MTDKVALAKATADPNPIRQFERWFADAKATGMSEQDATSMTLATSDKTGQPSARIVLLKDFDEQGFVFYTNYNSRKGEDLAGNSRACLLFYWSPLWRQVRIEGAVAKVSEAESDEYFHSRPLGSKLGAWASDQSEPVESREQLEKRFEEFNRKFADNVPRPPHWGGYRVKPEVIEFWQGRENRLHDRLRYNRQPDGSWIIERLAP
ncbi:MAG TPA: pyridoxamine 5'-phosphate oxidase [Pyrinomonadaceae bacterium]|nr:pyridoxamine 5'-phosphate oxidase [Pyrinomonadaceae bacterium]